MAWEPRRRKRYYYAKRRRGSHVESHYIGAGEAAQVIAALEALYREQRTAEREQWRREQQSHRAADADIDRLGAGIRLLVAAALLAAGYHTHKGQWRSRYDHYQATHSAQGSETTP